MQIKLQKYFIMSRKNEKFELSAWFSQTAALYSELSLLRIYAVLTIWFAGDGDIECNKQGDAFGKANRRENLSESIFKWN